VSTIVGVRPVWTLDGAVECEVQLRAHGETVPASVSVDGGRLTARLARPARGIATGQAIVCYRPSPEGDVVLGSATIAETS
jgi:tRNA-specific 2-thiouridylase